MFQLSIRTCKSLIGLAVALCAALPVQAQPVITDPDAANAPIPDREVYGMSPALTRRVPTMNDLRVPPTNYPVPDGAIWVAPTGKAMASGLKRDAPTTLAHAVQSAPEGATVVLRGGDYRDVKNLKIERRLTLQPAPGESVWIKGSDIVTGWRLDGANANGTPRYSIAWDKKFNDDQPQNVDKDHPIAGDTDMVFVDGKSLEQVATLDEVKSGTFCVDTATKKLIMGDNPKGKTVEVTARPNGLVINGQQQAGLIVRGLGFAHYAGQGIISTGRERLFENNIFAWNALRGMTLNGPSNIVRGNVFACNGLVGMAGVFTDKLLFENNRVLFNNIEGFRGTWSAAGTKFIVSKDMTIRNNFFEGNNATVVWLDISCMNVDVIGNTIQHNKGLGIFYECTYGGTIAFNVCEDNNVGIMLSDASSTRVWNNTLVGNSKGVIVKDTPRVNNEAPTGFYKTAAADYAAGATWISTGNEFHNNLIAGGRNDKTVLFDAAAAGKGKTSPDQLRALDATVYARVGDTPPRILVRWNDNGKTEDYESLEAFGAAHPTYAANATLLESSPFVGPDNYALAPDSPLLKLGHELTPEVRALASDAGLKLPAGARFIGARGSVE